MDSGQRIRLALSAFDSELAVKLSSFGAAQTALSGPCVLRNNLCIHVNDLNQQSSSIAVNDPLGLGDKEVCLLSVAGEIIGDKDVRVGASTVGDNVDRSFCKKSEVKTIFQEETKDALPQD